MQPNLTKTITESYYMTSNVPDLKFLDSSHNESHSSLRTQVQSESNTNPDSSLIRVEFESRHLKLLVYNVYYTYAFGSDVILTSL